MLLTSRRGLYGGIAILTFAAIVLEVFFARLVAVLEGPHFEPFAAAVAIFGVGAGGVVVQTAPRLVPPEALISRSAVLGGFAAAAAIVALLVVLHVGPIERFDASSTLRLILLAVAMSAPFAMIGAVLSAALRDSGEEAPWLFAAIAAGAAAGGLGALVTLRAVGLRAGLLAALIAGGGALILHFAAVRAGERAARGSLIATFVMCALVLLTGDLGSPWLKLPPLRFGMGDKVEYQAWSEDSVVTVDRAAAGQAWVRANGVSATLMLEPKTQPVAGPDELAFAMNHERGPTLVLGAGAGRDVRVALKNGQKEVYAAEGEALVVEDVVRGQYKEFAGDLYARPDVHATVAEGRTYVRRSPYAFRNLVLAYAEDGDASAAGVLALTPSTLFTVEAFADDLAHLTPDGLLMVTRTDTQFERLLALTVAALSRSGAEKPADHIFACTSAAHTTTLVAGRSPLPKPTLAALRRHCQHGRFAEAFAPDDPRGALHKLIGSGGLPENPARDLSVPTDDRPFFFATLPFEGIAAALLHPARFEGSQQAVLLILGTVLMSAAIALLLISAAFFARPEDLLRAVDAGPRARALGSFALAGAGAAFVRVPLEHALGSFVGQAGHARAIAMIGFWGWVCAGAVLTRRGRLRELATVALAAEGLVVASAMFALGLTPLLGLVVALPTALRAFLALVLLAPIGVLAGALAPLGVRSMGRIWQPLLPWSVGLVGIAAGVATALGALAACEFGFGALWLFGGGCFLATALLAPSAGAAPPSPELPIDPQPLE